MLHKQYTYRYVNDNKNGQRCARSVAASRKCRGYIIVCEERITVFNEHNHDAPKYYITSSEDFVRIYDN